MPGLRNVGLLATQELRAGVPDRPDWRASGERARPLLGLRGRQSLGYGIEVLSTNTSMLTINGRNRAIAVFCDEDEPFDAPAQRFNGTSPVSQALAVADQKAVDWVILTRSSEIRLYAARSDTGVGRKGRAETFVELNLSLLPAELAGYLHLLFSADALMENGTLETILDRSADFAAELAVRLRERVYFQTVPALLRCHRPTAGAQPHRCRFGRRLRAGDGDPVPAAVRGLRRGQGPSPLPNQRPLHRPFAQAHGTSVGGGPAGGHRPLRRTRQIPVARRAGGLASSERRQLPAGVFPPTTAASSPTIRK